ncbi:FecR family protein [Methylorubrum sp. SL192]|uniref:FecR family protein n=1 Tax=Methylorubrum sp. SL192 TaxID=2995167 RepID=UPI001477DEB1|nr:DUF4880 domain-containing protein [Methylorubrum sp. SL192]MCY1644731.1 DUF4880 domain-containing protein [Methylorubrum sp. SL192]
MSGVDQLEDPRAEAAVGWMVEMGSGPMSEHQIRAFEAWLEADPLNEAAWIRLQGGMMPYGIASRHRLQPDLLARRRGRSPTRRTLLTGLCAVLGAGAAGGSLLNRFVPLGGVLADHVTLTAQNRSVPLADGSETVLSPRTAMNLRYEPGLRGIQLVSGEVLVRIASRATPFHVTVGPLTLRAQAGIFVLEDRNEVVTVTGVQGTGELAGLGAEGPQAVAPGDLLEFGDGRLHRLVADRDAATAWLDGLLVAKDRPLAAIVDKLRPYFPGVIRVDPSVSALRVTGVFSLKDPSAALDALAESLDLSISRLTHYWVSLGPRAAAA